MDISATANISKRKGKYPKLKTPLPLGVKILTDELGLVTFHLIESETRTLVKAVESEMNGKPVILILPINHETEYQILQDSLLTTIATGRGIPGVAEKAKTPKILN